MGLKKKKKKIKKNLRTLQDLPCENGDEVQFLLRGTETLKQEPGGICLRKAVTSSR